MTIRLKIAAKVDGFPITFEIALPARGQTFTMTRLGARQLADRLNRLADMLDVAGQEQ